jgi:hypothetical protein
VKYITRDIGQPEIEAERFFRPRHSANPAKSKAISPK